jgi:hypothetical protein
MMARPRDQCHIFIQTHLLEWSNILVNDEVISIMHERVAELHIYDNEGRLCNHVGEII